MQLPKQVGNQYRRWANFGSLSELSYTLSSAFVSHKTFLARLLSAPPPCLLHPGTCTAVRNDGRGTCPSAPISYASGGKERGRQCAGVSRRTFDDA